MLGISEATKRDSRALLDYLCDLYLQKNPDQRSMLRVTYDGRIPPKLRARVTHELLKTPLAAAQIREIMAMFCWDREVTAAAWATLKKAGPTAEILLGVLRSCAPCKDEAAALLLADPALSATLLVEIVRHSDTRQGEAADRILALAKTVPNDDAVKSALTRVLRLGDQRSEDAWALLLAGEPREQDLHYLMDSVVGYSLRAREELARRYPASVHLQRMPNNLAPADTRMRTLVAAHLAAMPLTDRDVLFRAIKANPDRVEELWQRYLASEPSVDDLKALVRGEETCERAWAALQGVTVDNAALLYLYTNVPNEHIRASIWERIKAQSPTNEQLRGIVAETPAGREAAAMLLQRNPSGHDFRAIIANLPSLREGVRELVTAANPFTESELRDWMRSVADWLDD